MRESSVEGSFFETLTTTPLGPFTTPLWSLFDVHIHVQSPHTRRTGVIVEELNLLEGAKGRGIF